MAWQCRCGRPHGEPTPDWDRLKRAVTATGARESLSQAEIVAGLAQLLETGGIRFQH